MNPFRLKLLRLLFWACWATAVSFPFLMLLKWSGRGDVIPVGYGIFFVALIGLGMISIDLLKDQPSLARFGMISLGLSIALFLLFGTFMGPTTD